VSLRAGESRGMRTIAFNTIVEHTKRLCIGESQILDGSMVKRFQSARQTQSSPPGREVQQLVDNAQIAREEGYPICQDIAHAVFFVELGQDIRIEGGALTDAINKGVAEACREGYPRYSIVADPLKRKDTGDISAVLTLQLVRGDRLRLSFLAKGAGCDNMSGFKMLTPADGVNGVKDFVLDTVRAASGKPCPPVVVGVGMGGTFDLCCMLAEKALFRGLGAGHPDPFYAQLETELLDEINRLGTGPKRLDGRTTTVAVHIETLPCHIASLPVAVNMNCHAHGHRSVVL